MATFDVAKLLNKITQDIPGINTVLKALAKWDVSALSDVPDGAMQATTDTNNRLTIKKKVSGSYTPVAKLMHDVDTVDGYHASTGATANTVAVRNASGALPGDILGNAATANTATALAAGAVVPVNQGGTGATTASQARANLGAANDAVFTAHIAKQASPSVEGHVKLDALAADGSNTAAPGGYGLGMPGAKQIPANTDLDSIVLPGFYSCKTDSAAGQLLNCPTARAFSMLVEHGGYGPTQTLHTFDNALRYRRTKVNANSFSGWAQVPGGISDSTSTTSSTIAASATAVKAVNDSLGQVQVQGAASWSADSAPYPINAQVYHNGKQWLALRANSAKPVEGADWSAIGTAATANLTTSNTDGTAGRVLKVGDGGWMGQGVHQVEPLGYPTSIKDITNQTKVIRADSDDNGVSQYATGIHFAALNTWGRLRVHHYVPSAWVQGGAAFAGTGWTSRVVLSGNLLQTTGQSTEYPMSQKAVTDALDALDALGQPSMTGSATLNGTTNNTVQLTGIVTTLGLEVGDVIRIQYSGYNKLHTVESITNNNLIVVNYEHAGNRGNGSLKLPVTTTNVKVTRIAKWYNAPIGLGQAWVDVTAARRLNTQYVSPPNRSFGLNITTNLNSGIYKLTVDGVVVVSYKDDYSTGIQFAVINVSNNYKYEIGATSWFRWRELR